MVFGKANLERGGTLSGQKYPMIKQNGLCVRVYDIRPSVICPLYGHIEGSRPPEHILHAHSISLSRDPP